MNSKLKSKASLNAKLSAFLIILTALIFSLVLGGYFLAEEAGYLVATAQSTESESSRKSVNNTAVDCSFGSNLIVNGDAEADPSATGDGTVNYDVSAWVNETGDFTITKYNASNGFPTSTAPGPENRGVFFFSGGRTALSTASQTVDVATCAAEIDSNTQRFLLNGFLGGWTSSNDQAKVSLSFRDAGNAEIGTASIGPVTAGDRRGITGLFPRSSSGIVPTGTRTIEVSQQITRFDTTFNDGYADSLSLTLTAPQQACAPLPPNIMSWWQANGDANDFLEVNNGVLQNGTTFSSGLAGQAFNFDGVDDHVTVARTIQDDFTIEFWINTTQNVASSATQWYSGRGLVDAEVTSVTNDFGVSLLNGKVYFGTGNPDVTIISGVVADGNWHHVAATRKRSTGDMRLYVDGDVVAAAAAGTQSLTAPPRIVFGRIQVGNNPFQGKLDEISIYSRAISLSEIQAIYHAGAMGKCGLSTIQSLTLDPSTVTGGQSSTGTVTLTSPASPEGAIVTFASENPDAAQVPATVTVLPGETTATFPVTTSILAVDSTSLITASYQTETASALITITAPRADLTITSANGPASAVTDSAFNISWRLTNQGVARAKSPWKDKIFISNDNQVGGDALVAEFPFSVDLEVGQTADRIQTIAIPANSISANGQYFLMIMTDADNQVVESNESNNVAVVPVMVTRPPKPDLIIENITAPATAFFEQNITVQVKVKNIGDGPTNAPDWRDFAYISVDDIPEIEDPFKIAAPNTSYLGPGESYTSTFEVKIPRGLVGQYKIIVWTDSDGSNHRTNAWPQRVVEVNEENNYGIALPIQITAPPLPDLRASAVAVPGEVFAGGQMALTWRIDNNGDGATPTDQITWKDYIFLSDNTVFDASDRLIGSRERSGALGPKDGYTVSNYTVTLPNDIAGDKYVFVVADGNNKVYEFLGENNNADYDRQQPGSPMHIGATPPDLVIPGAINAPPAANTGQSVPITWTVMNQGAFDAAPNWFDTIYLSSDQNLDTANDTLLTSVFRSAPLGPGLTYEATANVVLPSCLEGTYYIYVVADGRGQIFEYDPKQNAEQNNASPARPIAISNTASDLVVTTVGHPAAGSAGQPLSVSWTVSNQGIGPTRAAWTDRVYLSQTNVFNGSTAILAGSFDHNGFLASGQSYMRAESISVPNTAQGAYFVHVVTDARGEEEECANNLNNSGSGGGTVSITNSLPDLVVQNAGLQSNFVGGQTAHIGFTIANSGTVPANNGTWGDAVYFSDNTSLDPNDRRIGNAAASGPLATGASYDRQLEVVLPVVNPGSYFLIVKTDYLDNVFEAQGENNNTRAIAIPIDIPAVDLRVTSVNTPGSAFSGQTMNVDFTVANTGMNASVGSQWTDEFVLSADQIADPTDRVVGYTQHNGALPGGGNYGATASVLVPSGLAGQYYFFVRTDRNNQIAESDEANNASLLSPISLQLTPPADLVVTSVSPVASAAPGEPVTFSWAVQNMGSNAALGLWNDVIYLSTDPNWDAGDILIDRHSQLGPVNGGQSYNGSLTLDLPAVNPGNYYVIVRTDVRNNVRETDESNNNRAAATQTAVDVPELQIGVSKNVSLLSGKEKFYKTNTPANEELRLLIRGQAGSANELFARFGQIASSNGYEFSYSRPNEPDQEIIIPDTQAGNYFSRVKSSHSVPASQNVVVKAELIPFGITSVSPNRVGDNGQVTITLRGARFQEGATVKLIQGDTILTASTVIRIDSSTVKARFQFTNAPHGEYGVVLMNPNKQSATLSNSLTIEQVQVAQPTIVSAGDFRGRPSRSIGFYNVVRNPGNVDIQYVAIRTQVFRPDSSDRVTIINYRPENSLPRKTDFPTVDWNNNPLTNSTFRNLTTDTFLYRDLAPGEAISYNTEIRGLNTDNSYVRSQTVGLNRSEMIGALRESLEAIREEMIRSGASIPNIDTANEWWENYVDPFLHLYGFIDEIAEDDISSWRLGIRSAIRGAIAEAASNAFTGACNIVVDATVTNCGIKCAAKFGCCNIGTVSSALAAVGYISAGGPVGVGFGIMEGIGGALNAAKCVKDGFNCANSCPQPTPPDCQPPKGTQSEEFAKTCVLAAIDPNEKSSPDGYGEQRFVSVQQEIPYTINFENLSEATAYAQRIRITDQLDPDLDWRTFRLKEIGFKQYRFQVPENRAFFQQRVQLGADLNNLVADISAGIDISTGTVTWTLTAIDPATGEQPNATDLGLLPPNNENNDGQGFVTFTVKPKAAASTGTVIENKATITFDTEEPIETNAVSNTLDADAPASEVTPLPAISGPGIAVNWSGSDGPNGSGLRSYDVFVSENGGSYETFTIGTTEISRQFIGSRGKTYRFYSVAYDNAGNKEAVPSVPDAVTTVAGGAFEADLDPRPNGSNDGTISANDVAQTAKFVVGLETPDQPVSTNEFQRADCAPRSSLGNGAITVVDLAQAGRYAAGLDATQAVGGAISGGSGLVSGKQARLSETREIRPARIFRTGNKLAIAIELVTGGEVNAVGFTLDFDPAVLSNPSNILPGPGAGGASVVFNAGQSAQGKLGMAVFKPAGQTFAAGTQQIVMIEFDVVPGPIASTGIGFGDQVAARDTADVNAGSLPTNFTAASIALTSPTAASVTIGGRVINAAGTGIGGARLTMTDTAGGGRTAVTNPFGYYSFTDVRAGTSVFISVTAKRYSFTTNSQVVQINDDNYDVNFTANN